MPRFTHLLAAAGVTATILGASGTAHAACDNVFSSCNAAGRTCIQIDKCEGGRTEVTIMTYANNGGDT